MVMKSRKKSKKGRGSRKNTLDPSGARPLGYSTPAASSPLPTHFGHAMSTTAIGTMQPSGSIRSPKGAPNSLFGSPLRKVVKKQASFEYCPKDMDVPVFVAECCEKLLKSGMGATGLFRISGTQEKINELYDKCNDLSVAPDVQKYDHHVVASLVKMYLRELPEPLLTWELGPKFLKASDILDEEERLREIADLVRSLPKCNRITLSYIIRTCKVAEDNAFINKMNAENIGLVVGPNLYWSKDDSEVNLEAMMQTNRVAKEIIIHYWTIFKDDHPCQIRTGNMVLHTKHTGHQKSVQVLLRTENTIWSGDSLGMVRIYDANKCTFVKEVDTGMKNMFCMEKVGDSVWIGGANSIQIRQADGGDELKSLAWFGYSLCKVGREVWSGGEQKIRVWDPEQGYECVREITVSPTVLIFSLLYYKGEVWSGCSDKCIRVYDARTGEFIKEFPAHDRRINSMTAVHDHIWTASDDTKVCIWNATTKELVHTIEKHDSYVYDVEAFGAHVWSCSWDKKIFIWDSKSFELVMELPSYHDDAVSVVLPCYNRVLEVWQSWTGSWDKTLNVWNLEGHKMPKLYGKESTGSMIRPYRGQQRAAAAAFPALPRMTIIVAFENTLCAFDRAVLELFAQVHPGEACPSFEELASASIEDNFAPPNGRIVRHLLESSLLYDRLELTLGAQEVLELFDSCDMDVRLWVRSCASAAVIQHKMAWIEHRFGRSWVRNAIVCDVSALPLLRANYLVGTYPESPAPKERTPQWKYVVYSHPCNLDGRELPPTPGSSPTMMSRKESAGPEKRIESWEGLDVAEVFAPSE